MPKIITTEITATQYFSTVKYASCLMIDDPVLLVRVPDHAKDPNAIRVELDTGEQLGFIERKLAATLAPELDKRNAPLPAFVSGLDGGKFTTEPRIRISFTLEQKETTDTIPKIEYFADCTGKHAYILLNTTESIVKEIIDTLQKSGFVYNKSGISHKPSADGRQYEWYVEINKPVDDCIKNQSEEHIDTFFKDHYGICSPAGKLRDLQKELEQEKQKLNEIQNDLDKSETDLQKAAEDIETHKREAGFAVDQALEYEQIAEKLQKAYDIKEREAAELRQQREALRLEVTMIERQEQRLKNIQTGKQSPKTSNLDNIISVLCPSIKFLRDSLDELSSLPDPAQALKSIGILSTNPEKLKGERFEGTDFKELRYSTGQSDDGRMYYRVGKERVDVLVSKKSVQGKMDKDYLKKA
jgi:uncharacterized phage infection (PIP) family protein YhgE